jgi:hypothetical protein
VPCDIDVAAKLWAGAFAQPLLSAPGLEWTRQVRARTGKCGARRGHFDTKDTKITKGTKESYGAFAAETAGNQPRDDLKASFAAFALRVLRVEMPTIHPRIQSFAAESMTWRRRREPALPAFAPCFA